MIQNINELYGYKLSASDGEIGHIKDFYFDDHDWVIRYLVADTGSWITNNKVLLTPHNFGHFDVLNKQLLVRLTKQQIENSPSIELHQPVSRQYEMEYYRYYGLPYYWDGGSLWGAGSYPMAMPIPSWGTSVHVHLHGEDRNLRSAREVTGYAIRAEDGVIGTVCGILIDDTHWVIKELIIETGHWYAGKKIRLLPEHITGINYANSTVEVNLTKEDLKKTSKGEIAHLMK
jgi:hypothetical protein